MAIDVRRRRFTVEEYDRMAEVGILTADDRVELLDGEIIEMAPIYPPHSSVVDRLTRLFTARLGERAIVRVGGPIALVEQDSEPQPDLTLLRPRVDFYSHRHPRPADVLLAVEVMDSSVERDRRLKLPIYARAGLAEVWLVDIPASSIDVFRQPEPGGYRSTATRQRGGRLAAAAFPEVTYTVDEILG
jgi:Uma2 family endonuclease